jgi:hypothetical protein
VNAQNLPATPDPSKFENVHQLGGIRTGTLDSPGVGVRVALVETGSGLRFTVALDRGGDIIDAAYLQHGLAYLSPNGLRPPSPAYHVENEWLRGWSGGLVTTCGPEYIGGSRVEQGVRTSLHGRYSNTPSTVERVFNPDPSRGRYEMGMDLIVRDTRVFGPVFEVRRKIRCTLGRPEILIEDEVTNRGDAPAAHHWLYHCNLGYPFLDEGARFIYSGRAEYWVVPPPPGEDIVQPLDAAAMNAMKVVPAPLAQHAGGGERGLVVDAEAGRDGFCRVGMINPRLELGLVVEYPSEALPRLAHWQHFGPHGSYATAIEPFFGSLLGSARDHRVPGRPSLEPGESRLYSLRLSVLGQPSDLAAFAAQDRPVAPL